MILCLCLNAAIDKTLVVSPFRLNAIHRPQQMLALPGGKGCNVARALKTLGETAVVSGWVGGFAGQFIETGLEREGIQTEFIRIDGESRTCLSILDPEAGTVTEVYEKSVAISPEKLADLKTYFHASVGKYDAVSLSGSLPAGVPTDFYAQLIEIAHSVHVPVYLDSSGEALKRGLEAHPAFVKPNQREFADLAGGSFSTIDDYAAAAVNISTQYNTTVMLSLGGQGALAAFTTMVYQAVPPLVEVVSAVGSGDCLLAGTLYAMVRNGTLRDQLWTGVAAGTANTLRLGAGIFTLEDFDQVYAKVTIKALG